jgi:hypothetical protein
MKALMPEKGSEGSEGSELGFENNSIGDSGISVYIGGDEVSRDSGLWMYPTHTAVSQPDAGKRHKRGRKRHDGKAGISA